MKLLKKYLAIFLCFVMILSMTNTAFAVNNITTSEKVEMYSVKVISNEYDDTYVTFYEVKEKYYLSFNDVKKFTRFELEENDTDIILTQGLRKIIIEKSSGNMTDCEYVNQGNIDIVQYNGDYLCEGIPMLMYLGASCKIKENKALEVMMPDITIWEAIMPNYLDYYVNIADLYGGEKNVKICLACDIIADILDGVNGHGLFADVNVHIEDALYEILNVDITKYESVKELMADKNQRVNDFLSGEWVSDFLDTGSSATSTVKEIIDYYSNFYFAGEISDSGDLKEASELSKEINQQLYEQAVIKANLDEADNILKTLDIGKIALDTAITSYNLMRYDDDTKNLFSRTINEEMFKYAGYNDISWSDIAGKISRDLSSNEAIIQSAARDSVVSYIDGKLTDEGIKFVLSELTSKAGIYTSAVQIGTFVASLFNYNRNQAYSAEMNAIWLNIVQYDVAQLTARMLIKERDEYHFTDMASLAKIKDMFTLYYRTLIAFSENLAESIKEFGGNNREIWAQYFGGTSGESVGSYAAEYLYKITNCTVVPIVDYSGLFDELLSAEWLSQFKAEVSSNQWKQAYIDYINENARIYDYKRNEYKEIICKLVDINGDSIPELYIDFPSVAQGSVICTYHEGIVVEQHMYVSGLSYVKGQNIFMDSGGHMDEYYNKIYCIKNGQFVLISEGQYGAPDNAHVQVGADGKLIYNYYWNGKQVASETEYKNMLNAAYDTKEAVTPYDGTEYKNGRYVGNGLCDYEEIIEAIKTY